MRNTKAADQAKDLARANFERAGRELTQAEIEFRAAVRAKEKAIELASKAESLWYDANSAFSRAAEELRKQL